MHRPHLACAVFALLLAGLPAQTLTYINDGSTLAFSKGWVLSAAGDVNGDGIPDLLVGAPDTILGAGTAQVISLATNTVIRSVVGEATGNQFGSAVSGGYDVNGDNVPDLLIGAPGFDVGTPFDNRGKAYVYSGATGALLYSVVGANPYDTFGTSVAFLGDIDGDGKSEFAVGAPGYNSLQGRVTIHRGSDGLVIQTLTGEAVGDRFGTSVAAARDITGDNLPDLLVGAPYQAVNGGAGRAYLYSGANGALVRSFDGLQGAEHLGQEVCGVSDLNGDGVKDVVFGAPDYDSGLATDAGRARAYSGANGNFLWEIVGPLVFMKAGLDIDGVNDLDGDGVGDVLVGMPYIPP